MRGRLAHPLQAALRQAFGLAEEQAAQPRLGAARQPLFRAAHGKRARALLPQSKGKGHAQPAAAARNQDRPLKQWLHLPSPVRPGPSASPTQDAALDEPAPGRKARALLIIMKARPDPDAGDELRPYPLSIMVSRPSPGGGGSALHNHVRPARLASIPTQSGEPRKGSRNSGQHPHTGDKVSRTIHPSQRSFPVSGRNKAKTTPEPESLTAHGRDRWPGTTFPASARTSPHGIREPQAMVVLMASTSLCTRNKACRARSRG